MRALEGGVMHAIQILLALLVAMGTADVYAEDPVPGFKASGNEKLDTALNRLYKLAQDEKCTSIYESYE